MNEVLQAVISANLETQRKAHDLNVRAGEEIFTVLDRNGLQVFLNQQLRGARCVREIPNIEALRLPDLDSGMVDLVLEENPDTITVVGKEFPVTYLAGNNPHPTITVEGEDASVNYFWNRLPDEGITLPGGRMVSVIVKFGYYDPPFSEQDIPTLKRKVREYLNEKQWSSWNRPVIAIPNLSVEGAIVPEIVTAEYGRCVIEGTPLMAYGTVVVNSSRYYTSDPYFKGEWYRSLDEATANRQKVEGKIESVRAELHEQQERAAANQEAEAAKAKVSMLSSQHGSAFRSCLDSDLRDRLYNRAYSFLPSTSADLKAWTAESEALCAEVEAALVEIKRKKEEAEAEEAARRKNEIEQKVAENAFVRSIARPLIAPDEEEGEYTVYGVPFEGYTPCDPKDADIWHLYSRQSFEEAGDGMFILTPYKGFRSLRTGEDIYQLVENYLGGYDDKRMNAILDVLEAEEAGASPGTQEVSEASIENLAAQWGATIKRK